MTDAAIEALVKDLRRDTVPEGAQVLKSNPCSAGT